MLRNILFLALNRILIICKWTIINRKLICLLFCTICFVKKHSIFKICQRIILLNLILGKFNVIGEVTNTHIIILVIIIVCNIISFLIIKSFVIWIFFFLCMMLISLCCSFLLTLCMMVFFIIFIFIICFHNDMIMLLSDLSRSNFKIFFRIVHFTQNMLYLCNYLLIISIFHSVLQQLP